MTVQCPPAFRLKLVGIIIIIIIIITPWYPRRMQNWHALFGTLTRLSMVWFVAWILEGAQNYSLFQRCQTVSGAHVVLMLQDRQCTYDVKLRRVRATIVAVEKQWVLDSLYVCIGSLRYPACNARAPYSHLWPAPLENNLPLLIINYTISEIKKSF